VGSKAANAVAIARPALNNLFLFTVFICFFSFVVLLLHRGKLLCLPEIGLRDSVLAHAKIIFRAKVFERYATFSPGAIRDPRVCRGIWKKYCLAFATLGLGWLLQLSL